MHSVSIITTSLHSARFLGQAMRSVHEQGVVHLQHLVIGGGGYRDGRGLAEWSSHHVTRVSEPCRSQADAINKGLQRANGHIIGWLNDDDVYLPSTLATVIRYFRAHPDVQVVYGDTNHIDEDDRVIRTVRVGKWSPRKLRRKCFLASPAVFYRRDVVRQYGLLNEDLEYWADYEYWLRLADAPARFGRLPRILAGCRIHTVNGPSGKTSRRTTTAATEEALHMLASRYGRVPSRWILRHAKAMAASEGLSRKEARRYGRTAKEIHKALKPYYFRHWVCDSLYRLGLAKY